MAGQGAGMSGTGPPSEPPGDYAGPFAVERDRLTELLAGVQAADWDRPSPCPGWTVLGLCCHLVGDDLGLLARNRDGFLGTRAPAGSEAEFAAWLDELQAEWVRAARRLSPRLVTDLLRWAGPQISVMFAGEDVRARTASVSWAGPDLVPAWLGQARELSEYWITLALIAVVALIIISFAVHVLFSPWLLVVIAILAWVKFRPRRSHQ